MAELHFGSKEYFEKQSEFWFEENSKRISERDAYKKQRDELINDIAELRKQLEDKKMGNTLEIKLLSENATMPKRANSTDSGLDLYVSETTTINGQEEYSICYI